MTSSTIDLTAQRVQPEWSREERIAWAQAKYGPDAPFFWVIYAVGKNGTRDKVWEVDGLDVESKDAETVTRFGGGTYFRQLRVRNNPTAYVIVSETYGLGPSLGQSPLAASGSTDERLARLERMIERLAGGAPVAAAPHPADPSVYMAHVMQMAQMLHGQAKPPTPIDELLKVKQLAETLIEQRDEREERGGEYIEVGHMLLGIVQGLRDALGRPAPAPGLAGGPTHSPASTPTTPVAPSRPGVVATAPIPEPEAQRFLREPFPGAFDIMDAIKADPLLVPLVVGKDMAQDFEPLVRLVWEKIEANCGDPERIAETLGVRGIVESFVMIAPDAAEHRALLERAAQVFVESTREEGDEESPEEKAA